MIKIFKNMIPYWKTIILIVLLLVVQAYCDLALPQYTSDIIDTGIQNQGKSHILPEKISEEDYRLSQIYMKEDEVSEFQKQYKQTTDGYERVELTEEELTDLDEELMVPMVMAYKAANMSEADFKSALKEQMGEKGDSLDQMSLTQIGEMMHMDLQTFKAENDDGDEITYVDMRPIVAQMMEQQGQSQNSMEDSREQMNSMIEQVGDTTLKSMGIAYANDCEEKAGVDLDNAQMSYLWSEGSKMIMMAILMLGASIMVCYLAARVGAGIGRTLRENVFTRVVSFSNAEMDQFSTASLITRNTNDVQQIQMVTAMMLRMILYAPIIGIGGVIKVIGTGANMGWVIVLAVLVVMGLVLVLVSIAMPKFKAMQKLVDRVNLVSREILTGLSVIRAFGREQTEEKRFDEANKDLTKTQLFTNRVMTFMMPGMMLVMYGVTLLIVWVASHRIDAGTMQVGAMTAFITYTMQIIMAFLMLTMMSIMLPRAGVAAERIDEVVKTKTSIKETEKPVTLKEHFGEIAFHHVNFRYPGATEDVLSDMDFTVKPGKITAIIGSTGCGKSTLVNLIPRFYDVTGGEIELDGTDIRDFSLEELRNQIGIVPQKGVLFSGTIKSNLKFGKEQASQEDIAEALQIAQASEFVDEKEDGVESHIAQGGTNVSGGQKQRLAIARAIIKNPKVYIFDDSFSALDMKTDASLRKALEKKLISSSAIIVAQRVSTILHADQIIVLDDGHIAGIGTHRDLMETCEVYQQIAKSQLSEKELGKMGKEDPAYV